MTAQPSDGPAPFIAGSISPLGADSRPMPMPQPLLPLEVKKISSELDISDYTTENVDKAIVSPNEDFNPPGDPAATSR